MVVHSRHIGEETYARIVPKTQKIRHTEQELPSLVLGTVLRAIVESRPLACPEGGQPSRVTLGRNVQEIEVKGVPVAGGK